jgi:phospholipid/cholesterol/gamma-HCH transport system permease protein
MYEIGNKSVLFLTITMGCIGMILVYQGGLQTKRVVPDFSQLGATYLELLVRDLAASIGALMLATRVGAGIAAEIGSMVVTEQVDALRMCAADPIDYLIVPRFLASLVMTTALVIWSAFVAFSAGMITAYVAFDVPFQTFFDLHLVDYGDLLTGLGRVAYGSASDPHRERHVGAVDVRRIRGGVGWRRRAVVNSSPRGHHAQLHLSPHSSSESDAPKARIPDEGQCAVLWRGELLRRPTCRCISFRVHHRLKVAPYVLIADMKAHCEGFSLSSMGR